MATNLTGSKIKDTYGQLLHIDGGPTSLEKFVYSATGVATALKVGTTSVSVDNIKFDGNIISTTDVNGDLTLSPNGTGKVAVGNIRLTGNTISTSDTNGNLVLAPNGTGTVNIANANITGGTIGGVSFAGGSFTGITLISATTLTGTTTNGGNLRLSGNTLSSTDTNGNILLTPSGTGQVLATKVFGYGGSGTGGTVTQATSRTTGVTLDKLSGQITLFAATAISGHGSNEFTLTNSTIGANDVVHVCFASGLTGASYGVTVTAVSAGSCKITVSNFSNSATSADTPVLNFVVIKGVNA